jgi:hypothetical protein
MVDSGLCVGECKDSTSKVPTVKFVCVDSIACLKSMKTLFLARNLYIIILLKSSALMY